MTKTVEIDVAQTNLGELIAGLKPDDEVVIVRGDKAVAILLPSLHVPKLRRPGNCKGLITVVAEDREHLRGFEEYMP
ncbi:Antitoxin component of toxin-antitoxin stability system, DNA-binding transcriptional repressor [Planctomicrobium piriforme]|uniref:Antitoxin component of toxin-antitoxin stability system, DNA-binding transcriptional repressor n=2 Tax=Planctomicrobium piriforme TaxID=1576369 RepID=A0A1I3IIY8_9PLAN|nr:Antitoxin component of toxin-antitoxin stability system, DNA-binding transcriptional repressor [Planctomicrobium piriforme]